jgi:hypothetical protein
VLGGGEEREVLSGSQEREAIEVRGSGGRGVRGDRSRCRILHWERFPMAGVTDPLHLCWMEMLNDSLLLRATVTHNSTAVTAMVLAVKEAKGVATHFTRAAMSKEQEEGKMRRRGEGE